MLTYGLVFLVSGLGLAQADNQQPAPTEPLNCDVGPVDREFGGTDWLVYSCDDGISMVAITAKENPASPFIFIMKAEGDAYRIYGEGNGDRSASSAAGDDISRMTAQDFAALLAATKAVDAESAS